MRHICTNKRELIAFPFESLKELAIVASIYMGTVIFVLSLSYVLIKSISTEKKKSSLHEESAQIEIATTKEAMMKGLSGKMSIAPNHGMLFPFSSESIHCMWNKDVSFPVDVAFFDAQGIAINVEHMEAFSKIPACSAFPSKSALEMNAGWFNKHH